MMFCCERNIYDHGVCLGSTISPPRFGSLLRFRYKFAFQYTVNRLCLKFTFKTVEAVAGGSIEDYEQVSLVSWSHQTRQHSNVPTIDQMRCNPLNLPGMPEKSARSLIAGKQGQEVSLENLSQQDAEHPSRSREELEGSCYSRS